MELWHPKRERSSLSGRSHMADRRQRAMAHLRGQIKLVLGIIRLPDVLRVRAFIAEVLRQLANFFPDVVGCRPKPCIASRLARDAVGRVSPRRSETAERLGTTLLM